MVVNCTNFGTVVLKLTTFRLAMANLAQQTQDIESKLFNVGPTYNLLLSYHHIGINPYPADHDHCRF